MSELTRRILFAVPAAALFLWLTWLGGWAFTLLVTLIAVVATAEMIQLFSKIQPGVWWAVSTAVALIIWVVPWLSQTLLIAVPVLLILLTLILSAIGDYSVRHKWLASLFCGIYVPTGLLFFMQVRFFGEPQAGFFLTLALLLMIWGNDSFAYFGGRKFGRRPLAPAISPKKTWEGFWIGFIGSVLAAGLMVWLAPAFPLTFLQALPMAVVVSVLGPAGDLLESRIKRLAGAKDSSNLLPGHGGMLDRFDAFLLASPAVVIYLTFYFQ